MQTERRVAANPQTKPTDLGCESADRLAAIIRRHHRHLLLLLSSQGYVGTLSFLSIPAQLPYQVGSTLKKRHDMSRLYEQLHITG